MYGLTHAVFALALSYVLRLPVVSGILASLLPDVDALFVWDFPFSHRGVVHTPVAGLVAALVVYAVSGRRSTGYAVLLGYVSHLFLDTFTPSGVMWLYPWEGFFSWRFATASSFAVNMGITGFALLVFVVYRHRTRLEGWMRILNG